VKAIYTSPHWIADPELDYATIRELLREIGRLQAKIDAVKVLIADSYEGTRRIDGADLVIALSVEP